jgi:hypothetical protein
MTAGAEGLVTGLAVGTTIVEANYMAFAASADVTVVP